MDLPLFSDPLFVIDAIYTPQKVKYRPYMKLFPKHINIKGAT